MGLLAGLVVIALAAAAAVAFGPRLIARETALRSGDRVVVAFVSGSLGGVSIPRVIGLFERDTAGKLAVTLVDPASRVRGSGGSARTLADAFAFGGGQGLADALARSHGMGAVAWVVVPPSGLSALARETTLTVNITQQMNVSDGGRLYAFDEGTRTVAPGEVSALFEGIDAMPSGAARAQMRRRTARAVLAACASSPSGAERALLSAGTETSLRGPGFAAWARSTAGLLGSARIRGW
jgi:hypothetical protein